MTPRKLILTDNEVINLDLFGSASYLGQLLNVFRQISTIKGGLDHNVDWLSRQHLATILTVDGIKFASSNFKTCS